MNKFSKNWAGIHIHLFPVQHFFIHFHPKSLQYIYPDSSVFELHQLRKTKLPSAPTPSKAVARASKTQGITKPFLSGTSSSLLMIVSPQKLFKKCAEVNKERKY